MTRWERLQELFAQALALPAAERDSFVQRACAGDTALADELRGLLASDAAGDAPVQAAIGAAATRWVDDGRHTLIGQQLGAWRITAHIADGGMGAVFRAERADGQYQQPAALKLLNPSRVSAAAQERLAQERQILARLSHPHIARLLDGGRTPEGLPFLVMEFVDGQPIDTWCHTRALDTSARLRLFMQVCAAVDYAHRNLVVHRDLKPSNILVTAEGGPMLLDFGIAKLLQPETTAPGEPGSAGGLTLSGEQLLTPSHASPEQITGAAITTATDVYALGVLLYDLLAGQRPHEAAHSHPAQLARAIVETDPPRPSAAVAQSMTGNTGSNLTQGTSNRRLAQLQQRGAGLTPERLARELQGDLDNIVLMALRKEPERRYASAAALAEDIGRHLAHLPVRARPDTLAYRSAKLWRRHPVALPVSALALLLAVGGSAAFTWRLAQERDRALSAESAARTAEASAQRAATFSASVLARTSAENDAEREVSVQTLLQRAAERSETELADEASVGAQVDLALGSALSSWGGNDAALPVLQRALERARSRGDAGRAEAAAVLAAQSVALHGLGRLEDALAVAREAESLWQQVGTPAQRASATLDVAMMLNSLRRRDEAEPVFRSAIARLRAAHGGDHGDLAFALNNLAWGLHARGRLAEAAPLYEEALAMQQRLGLGMADRGQTLNNLAGLYYDQGDLDRADALWRQALEGYEALFGPEGHAAVTRAYSMAAWVPMARGQHERALALTGRAAAAIRRLLGERHRWTARAALGHGVALLGAGRLGEAQAELQRALDIQRAVLPAGHGDFISVHLQRGRLALAQQRPGVAEAELRQALQIADAQPETGRRRIDQVALYLGRALALQGTAPEAQALAQRARALAGERFDSDDYRLRALQAQLMLPPFATQLGSTERAEVQATLVLLRQQLAPHAPLVLDIERALAAAR
jgi:eukaryotic-like serine/threonine-protein kinase